MKLNRKIFVISIIILIVLSGCSIPIRVDSCNLDGERYANVKVDIGYDSKNITRNYYGYTNSYKQLVYVEAQELFLQQKKEEKYDGRLCQDEAYVKGVESPNYDQGHVIADSLGGVSNAYNITPQNSYLNRKGSQYELEQEWLNQLRNGDKITDVKVEITYPNNITQTPSHYKYSWKVNGQESSLEFDNKN